MNQSKVLCYCYDTVFSILKKEGEASGLYTVAECTMDENVKSAETFVYLGVSDLAQISQDKNGEKVFVTDADLSEQQFPAPTFMAFILSIRIASQRYQDALEAAGHLINYFKDNNTFPLDEYKWHGNKNNVIYMEPIIREPDINRMLNNFSTPSIMLEYRIEAAINSRKGGVFKRVQSREIRGKPIQ
jgi:hypothetical protein